jgi:hypothetical protein
VYKKVHVCSCYLLLSAVSPGRLIRFEYETGSEILQIKIRKIVSYNFLSYSGRIRGLITCIFSLKSLQKSKKSCQSPILCSSDFVTIFTGLVLGQDPDTDPNYE